MRHAESEGGTAVQLLASIRVLDITQIMRRSICGMLLADMGADLIKSRRVAALARISAVTGART